MPIRRLSEYRPWVAERFETELKRNPEAEIVTTGDAVAMLTVVHAAAARVALAKNDMETLETRIQQAMEGDSSFVDMIMSILLEAEKKAGRSLCNDSLRLMEIKFKNCEDNGELDGLMRLLEPIKAALTDAVEEDLQIYFLAEMRARIQALEGKVALDQGDVANFETHLMAALEQDEQVLNMVSPWLLEMPEERADTLLKKRPQLAEAILDHVFESRLDERAVRLLPLAQNLVALQSRTDDQERDRTLDARVHALQAYIALSNKDREGYALHMKEALFLAPADMDMLVEWNAEVQDRWELQRKRLNLDLALLDVDGKTTTLKQILANRKALLLDFWASWCGPCMASMPLLKKRSELLPHKGVAVVGINTEGNAEAARQVQKRFGIHAPWLLEDEQSTYANILKIEGIPHAVLLNADGVVLFSGHPEDDTLNQALLELENQP